MEDYGKSKGSDAGVKAACMRNPNKHSSLNDAPEGPGAHMLGYTGDSGVQGDDSVKHRSGTYHFK